MWTDGAQQSTTSYDSGTSFFTYDTNGYLSSVDINDGQPRTINYVTNAAGQILKRDVRLYQPA